MERSTALLQDTRTLFAAGTVAGLTDGELLDRFACRRGEAAEVAFASLVARHGPLVLGACRRILADPCDAEDAFQATFLVLVRKAGSLQVGESLAPWLYGVCTRIALRSRSRTARRRARETGAVEDLPGSPDPSPERRDLRSVLDEELGRLPERYRRPVVLCDLGGLTHEEAARELRCPAGTVKSRLSRGRERLRGRLARRGLAPEHALLGVAFPLGDLGVVIPSGLLKSTCLAATWLRASRAAGAGMVSTRVVALLNAERSAMMLAKLKTWTVAVLLMGGVGAAALALGGFCAPTGDAGPAEVPARKEAPREIRGVVLGPDNRPVPGATVVAGAFEINDRFEHEVRIVGSGPQVMTADAEGRFEWPLPAGSKFLSLVAHKDGFAAAVNMAFAPSLTESQIIKLPLGKPEPFTAVLVDAKGNPIAGAKVRIERYGIPHPAGMSIPAGRAIAGTDNRVEEVRPGGLAYRYVPRQLVEGSPVERLFIATTDEEGSFTFHTPGPGTGLNLKATALDGRALWSTRLNLRATAPDGRALWVRPGSPVDERTPWWMRDAGMIAAPPGEATRLVAVPVARVVGRVVSTLPGVGVSGLAAHYVDSRPDEADSPRVNPGGRVLTDSEGRFAFDGLGEGTVDVFLHGPGELKAWTYRAAKDVRLTSGATSEVTLELIRGVEVEGTVIARGRGEPVAGVVVVAKEPARPLTSALTCRVKTDARGRYRFRLPSGETSFSAMGLPRGFRKLPRGGSSRTVTIPDGTASYSVPPIELAAP